MPLVLLGCGKDDVVTKPILPTPIVYPVRSTPENALLYMMMAFENRDSVRTDSVYAEDYVGTSLDLVDPNPETLTFTKSDEVHIVGTLARSSSIVATHVLSIQSSWFRTNYASNPPGWATIQIPIFAVYVNDVVNGEYQMRIPLSGESWIFEFTLEPTIPDPSSPTDTTWQIVRWVESRTNN